VKNEIIVNNNPAMRAKVSRRARVERVKQLPVPRPKKSKPFSKAGGIAGRTVGAFFGRPNMGERIGSWFGSGIGALLGSGDYNGNLSGINKNSIVNPTKTDVPQISSRVFPNKVIGETRFRRREYLGDLISSGTIGAFSQLNYVINPGNPLMSPWLAEIAHNWEQYQLHGMIFEFKSMSGDFTGAVTTGTALGSVIMATQYDPSDPIFTSKFAMENYEYAQSFKPSVSGIHGLECLKSVDVLSELFIADVGGTIPVGADQKFYNFGRFTIASVGCPTANTNLGEVWVSYDISLFKAKLPNSVSFPGAVTSSSLHIGRANTQVAIDFLSTALVTSGNLNFTVSNSSIVITNAVPLVTYMATFRWTLNANVVTFPTVTFTGGVSLYSSGAGVPDSINFEYAGAIGSNPVLQIVFIRSDANGVITFTVSGGTAINSAKVFDFVITALDGSLLT
jgi:hypothetical protein